MAELIVSEDYTISIPVQMRDELDIKPGTVIEIFRFGDSVQMVPSVPVRALRGFLKGMDTRLERDQYRF